MHRSIICFTLLIILGFAGCRTSFTLKPTPTPEQLKLINGKIDACLILRPEEIEAVADLSDIEFASTVFPLDGTTACRYISVNTGEFPMTIFVGTDTTVREDDFLSSIDVGSARELYEISKTGDLNFEKEMSGPYMVQDIDNLGDQAYLTEGIFLGIHALKNNIFYVFHTQSNSGIGYDALLELSQMALQRMP